MISYPSFGFIFITAGELQLPLNPLPNSKLFPKIRHSSPNSALTLQTENKSGWLPLLVAIRSMAGKYTGFQANKSSFDHLINQHL